MSRWDRAVVDDVPAELHDRLALAVAGTVYRSSRRIQASDRFQRLLSKGGRFQRVLWASTSAKDPSTPDDLYVRCLAAPGTVNTMPDSTLEAFYDHGRLEGAMDPDGGRCDEELAAFAEAGIDVVELATRLQVEGAAAFVDAWRDLMAHIEAQAGSAA